MVATPMMQRGVDVNIPVAQRAAPMVSERLFVTVPISYRKARVVYLDDDPIRVDILEERVRQALLTKSGKEVFLRGDGAVQLQDLIEVMDRLKNAGVEKVGIVARLPGER
jgi:biopolymer transport protein ExbD